MPTPFVRGYLPLSLPLLSAVVVAGSCVGPSTPGPETGADAFLVGKTAQAVVGEGQQAGQNLLSQAERTGNALANRIGNELTVAAQNAVLVAGAEADRTIDKLSPEVSSVVHSLNDLIETAGNFQKTAFELKDATALDLRGAMGDIRLFVSKTDFMVQRIDGITQLENSRSPEYHLALTGLGLGQATNKARSHVQSVTINGNSISFVESQPKEYRTEINIPNANLSSYFTQTKVVFVPMEIAVQVEKKKLLGGWSEATYRVPIRLALVPRTAGTVTVSWSTEKSDWVNVLQKPAQYTHTTPDHDCHSGNCRYFPESGQQKVPNNQRFVEPQIFGCGGEGCPFTRNRRVSILGGGTILEFWIEAQGSPATHTYGAMIQELRVVGEIPGSKSSALQYGSDLVVELPSGTKFWRIRGTTTSFQPIDLVLDQSDEVLKYRTSVDSGGKKRIVYSVLRPAGL